MIERIITCPCGVSCPQGKGIPPLGKKKEKRDGTIIHLYDIYINGNPQ